MRFVLLVALACVGCDPYKDQRWAVTPVAIASVADSGPSGPTLVSIEPDFIDTSPRHVDAVNERSPDCTCGPTCTCEGCCCDAELGKRIEELPTVSPDTVEEPAEKPAFDVLIEIPADDQGYCPHCHNWIHGDGKNSESFTIQRAGYTVGIIKDENWEQGELLPRIYVRGKLLGTGAISANRILPLLEAKPPIANTGTAPASRVIETPGADRSGVAPEYPDLHSHRCDSCGNVWWHRSSQANERSHNCPRCGRYQDVVYRFADGGSR